MDVDGRSRSGGWIDGWVWFDGKFSTFVWSAWVYQVSDKHKEDLDILLFQANGERLL